MHDIRQSWQFFDISVIFLALPPTNENRTFISPEEEQDGLEEGSEVVVALEGGARVELDVAEELHPDDGVDEEQHEHEQPDVRQGLKVVKVNGCASNNRG